MIVKVYIVEHLLWLPEGRHKWIVINKHDWYVMAFWAYLGTIGTNRIVEPAER